MGLCQKLRAFRFFGLGFGVARERRPFRAAAELWCAAINFQTRPFGAIGLTLLALPLQREDVPAMANLDFGLAVFGGLWPPRVVGAGTIAALRTQHPRPTPSWLFYPQTPNKWIGLGMVSERAFLIVLLAENSGSGSKNLARQISTIFLPSGELTRRLTFGSFGRCIPAAQRFWEATAEGARPLRMVNSCFPGNAAAGTGNLVVGPFPVLVGARGSHEESPSRTWHARLPFAADGAWVLLGIRFLLEW